MRSQVNVRFDDQQFARIQSYASGHGLTASEVVRVAAGEYLDNHGVSEETDDYTRDGEWGGYTIHKAATGFIIEEWSRCQGDSTGGRYLLAYGSRAAGRYGKDADLSAAHNETMTVGEYLRHLTNLEQPTKVLRKGRIVR